MKAKVQRDHAKHFEADRRARGAHVLPDPMRRGWLLGYHQAGEPVRRAHPRLAGQGLRISLAKIRRAQLEREPDCRVCHNPAATVDHILAKAFGGSDHAENLQSVRGHATEEPPRLGTREEEERERR